MFYLAWSFMRQGGWRAIGKFRFAGLWYNLVRRINLRYMYVRARHSEVPIPGYTPMPLQEYCTHKQMHLQLMLMLKSRSGGLLATRRGLHDGATQHRIEHFILDVAILVAILCNEVLRATIAERIRVAEIADVI